MEAIKKANKYTGKVVLILCNIVLLLRAVPIDAMKKLWLFPVNYPAAEIGLIDQRGWRAHPEAWAMAMPLVDSMRLAVR